MQLANRPRRSPRLVVSSLLLLVSGLVAPVACNSEPEFAGEGGEDCETSEDCEVGESCHPSTNKCVASVCTSSADCEDGQFCSTMKFCEDQCATCGDACEATADCPDGQYCSEGTCQQECTPGDASAPECDDRRCTADGKCANNSDIDVGNGGMGGGDGDGDEPVDCIDVEVDFEPQIPNVVLLIDQSSSMTAGGGFGDAVDEAVADGTYVLGDCPSNNDWRWNVVRNILLNPDTGVIAPLEDSVRFGLSLYSSEDGDFEGPTCPMLTDVSIDFGTHAAMLAAYQCSDVVEDTPTRESLTAVAEALAAQDLEGPKVIVLATDGEPDTCVCPDWDDQASGGTPIPDCDPGNNANDVDYAGDDFHPAGTYEVDNFEQVQVVLEAQRIYEELGIQVEVINVSTPGNAPLAAHLDNVALAGGAVSGASIEGFDPGALHDAFQSIIDGVRSCAIDLDGMIEEGKEDTGTVILDGQELILDDPNGWQVNSPTQIELLGDACETIKTGDHELDITFPCDSFRPVVPK